MAASYFKLKILRQNRVKRIQTALYEESPFKNKAIAIENKCRVCLKDGAIPIFGDTNTSDISEYIRIFGGVEIKQSDDFPKHLCVACHSLLQSAILFKKIAKETDNLLRQKSRSCLMFNINVVSSPELIEIIKDDKPRLFSCKPCKLEFMTSNGYIAHKNSKQHNNVRIKCSKCNRLLTPQLYRKHLLRHQTTSHLICEICGKMYRKDNLIRHLQLHTFELPFQCQICPYRGRFLESLKIHVRTHNGNKPFSCDKCESRFLTRSNLNRHLLTHKDEKPLKCNECVKGFYTKNDLAVHLKSDHAGYKDYGCKICGTNYGNRKSLKRHELRVHKREKLSKGRLPLYLQTEYQKDSVSSLQAHHKTKLY